MRAAPMMIALDTQPPLARGTDYYDVFPPPSDVGGGEDEYVLPAAAPREQ